MVNYETQILALIEEGNPIRDPDLLVVDQAVSTIYLATLEERSSGMTPLKTIPEKDTTRRSTMLWLAAAVTIIIVGVATILAFQTSEESPPVTEPTTTTIAEVTPATTIEAAPTTVSSPTTTLDPWQALTTWSGQQWGEVRVTGFEPEVKFVVPDNTGRHCLPSAKAFDISPASLEVPTPENVSAAESRLVVARLDLGTVSETARALAELAGAATEPTPSMIGSADGVTFDASAPDGGSTFFNVDVCSLSWGFGQEWRFWVVDAAGEVVTFALFSATDELETFATEFQPILDSVVWRDLG